MFVTNKSVLHTLSLSIKRIKDYYCVFEPNKMLRYKFCGMMISSLNKSELLAEHHTILNKIIFEIQ